MVCQSNFLKPCQGFCSFGCPVVACLFAHAEQIDQHRILTVFDAISS